MLNPEQTKAESIRQLRSWDIPVIEHLPTLKIESKLSPKSATDVARRAIILSYVIGIGYGAKASKLKEGVSRFGLAPYLSKHEADILGRSKHSKQEKIDATWLDECIQGFAWCLGLTDINHFKPCDYDLIDRFPEPYTDPSGFISSAALRPLEEIYQQADLHYRLHWAAKHYDLSSKNILLSKSITRERRRAIDWVIGTEDNWDEVPSDT